MGTRRAADKAGGRKAGSMTDNGRFVRVPVSLIDSMERGEVSRGALAIYAVIGSYADKNGFAWPSVDTIAERAGCSRRLVGYALEELQNAGHLTIKRRGKRTAIFHLSLSSVDVQPVACHDVQPVACHTAASQAQPHAQNPTHELESLELESLELESEKTSTTTLQDTQILHTSATRQSGAGGSTGSSQENPMTFHTLPRWLRDKLELSGVMWRLYPDGMTAEEAGAWQGLVATHGQDLLLRWWGNLAAKRLSDITGNSPAAWYNGLIQNKLEEQRREREWYAQVVQPALAGR